MNAVVDGAGGTVAGLKPGQAANPPQPGKETMGEIALSGIPGHLIDQGRDNGVYQGLELVHRDTLPRSDLPVTSRDTAEDRPPADEVAFCCTPGFSKGPPYAAPIFIDGPSPGAFNRPVRRKIRVKLALPPSEAENRGVTVPDPAMPAQILARLILAALLLATALPAAAQQKQPKPPPPPKQNQTVSGPGVAMTGDLVTVGGASVRLQGIAAPVAGETCETRYGAVYDCYRKSTDVLQALIGDNQVSCEIVTADRTGQKVGICSVGNTDLAAAMVARGWAFAYRRLSPAYVNSEAFAESHRLGMWAGRVETPWQWKSRKLSDTAK